ncbi:virginiamycin B lyase family protein [Aliiglaciecola litoralis]|uniref:Virginiamycin B lyase n=1 Tax=Aliiglaciecola litoralis TaxID=582857 RepID=A0ABP3X171_9ALTE
MRTNFRLLLCLSMLLSLSSNNANATPNGLPEGAGQSLVQSYCVACHQTNRISFSSGYDRDDWQALIATMIEIEDEKQKNLLVDYLAQHFGPNDKRSPKLVAGNATISFKEWVTPTLGQRSRDPVEAPDGNIWWAGQWGNLIGNINPQTGEMREYPLPTGAMPHSVTPDKMGNIWYTGNKNGTVGMLDPKSEKMTTYDMPDLQARDPHTAVFDKQGVMWFTLQHSNKLGRLDPATGDIKLVSLPTPNSRPYGIKLDAHDRPWIACNGSNCLVEVDPKTMALREYKLPNSQTKVRRLDFDEQGMLWYVNSSLGRLGRFNPITKEVKEWPSPSGARSHPYAIAAVGDAIWYNESAMRPDALVKFDPKTETFQSWAIPSGSVYSGIVRHMRATSDGKLLIHQSATNRIIQVTID